MPDPWIDRTFETTFREPAPQLRLFPVWLLLGARQVGKSSLLQRCATSHRYVNLDDFTTRERVNRDPALFMRELEPPYVVDEIQYAPQLLPFIKQQVDGRSLPPGSIQLTGSQNFRVMAGVSESLAGRVAILNLHGLSNEEKAPAGRPAPDDRFAALLETGFPRLRGNQDAAARDLYLSSYVQTYIERDIRELLRVEKRREFETFIRLCALRTGQVVNHQGLARDANVAPATAKEWLSLLEDCFLLKLVQPWFSNQAKRLIKSPKLYFMDAGLAAWLAGWRTANSARLGPMGGALFETEVLSDMLKRFSHRALEASVHFWRTRDGQEIDFLLSTGGSVFPVEVKMGSPRHERLAPLERIAEANWKQGQVASLTASEQPVGLSDAWRLCLPESLEFA